MKKLQSLENFKTQGLHKIALSTVKGGYVKPDTVGGTQCCNEALSSTGCFSYESDTILDGGGVSYHNTKDIAV